MEIDIARLVSSVTREVTSRDHEGRPARVVVMRRVYGADIDDVWDAITSAERIPRWLLPISGELRLGGRYQLEGNAGGEITRCDAPRHLAVTWEFEGDVSWVEVRLADDDGGTRLELEHVAYVDDARWDEFGPGAVGVGWDLALFGLGKHLVTGAAVDPAASVAWLSSDGGSEFVRLASDDWCRASIAGGTDAVAAEGAAERTRLAYTAANGGAPSD
jgi:uncharacterized protein YndB with AHSA1/START domain